MPYCFFGSSIKFQGHKGWKIDDLNPIWVRLLGRSQLSNPSDLPCSRSSIKFLGHTALKIVKFDPDWAFPDSNSSLNSPMAMKWCTKLEVVQKRCDIVFQGHTSNCKVTWQKNRPFWPRSRSSIKFQGHTALKIGALDPNWAFPDCNSSLNSPMAMKWCTKLEVA